MKKRIRRWIKAVRYLFNFQKPMFREFNCIDIVAGNKQLFLMAWEMMNAGRIKVHPGRHVYRKIAGAIIIALPTDASSVDISIHTCWRKTVLTVPIKKLTLDKESFEWLTHDIRLFPLVTLSNLSPGHLVFLADTKIKAPLLPTFFYQSNINPLFNYQNLNSI